MKAKGTVEHTGGQEVCVPPPSHIAFAVPTHRFPVGPRGPEVQLTSKVNMLCVILE